jgi:hypothetical protein
MPRVTYVQLPDGSLVEKTGDYAGIIPGDTPTGPAILPDIKPYRSMITGETITSRSRHREHLREHNCIEVGNERLPPPRREASPIGRDLRAELIARIKG